MPSLPKPRLRRSARARVDSARLEATEPRVEEVSFGDLRWINIERPEAVLADVASVERVGRFAFLALKRLDSHESPFHVESLRRCCDGGPVQAPCHISMELAPFPADDCPPSGCRGFTGPFPSTPLDAHGYVRAGKHSGRTEGCKARARITREGTMSDDPRSTSHADASEATSPPLRAVAGRRPRPAAQH